MSTKIYHGYRLAEGVDLFAFLGTLRDTMDPVRDRLDAHALMAYALHAVVKADRAGTPRPARPLMDALDAFDDRQRKTDPDSRGHDPHRFEVSFGRDPLTKRVLALLYTDAAEFTAAWEALPEVEPYGYWNNTDRPDDVTDTEWDERREAWDRLGILDHPPIGRTISFSLRPSPSYDIGMMKMASSAGRNPDVEALLRSAAPTRSDLARAQAVDLLTAQARESGSVAADHPHALVHAIIDWRRALRDPSSPIHRVVEACEQALAANDARPGGDIYDYVFRPRSLLDAAAAAEDRTLPLDLTAATAAARDYVATSAKVAT